MHSSELLKGTLQTIILKLLRDNPKLYGYEITQRVKELSEGTILLTEGSLYPTLHKLEAEGYLKRKLLRWANGCANIMLLPGMAKKRQQNEYRSLLRSSPR